MLGQRGLFTLRDALAVRKLSQQETRLGLQVRSALQIIDEAVQRYGDSLALSFNGGKDCTVLAHLLAAAVCDKQDSKASSEASTSKGQSPIPNGSNNHSNSNGTSAASTSNGFPSSHTNGSSSTHPSSSTSHSYASIPCIYVQCQSPFPQVEEFVDVSRARYNLDLWRISAPMKEALSQYKRQHLDHTGKRIEAVLVGTRYGDPYSDKLKPFQPTDQGWPDLMRVHPILDWSYHDIWDFLRSEELGEGGIGWCSLYNYGYTSLGSTFNTIPNPELRDSASSSGWKPAWLLEDASAERAGRPAGPIPSEIAKSLDHHKSPSQQHENGDKKSDVQ